MDFRHKMQRALEFYNQCLEDGRIKRDVLKGLDHQCKLNWLASNDFPKKLINVRNIDENFVFPTKHIEDFKVKYNLQQIEEDNEKDNEE